mgnify:CR=1 FL=1
MALWTYILRDGANAPVTRQISDHELSWALARTVLGYSISLPNRARFAAIMQSVLDLMVEPVSGPLALIADYQQVFRDFSGTSRVGELGQALAYHHFATASPFTHIADFVGWVESRGGDVKGESTPDFILLNAASSRRPVGLLEAKGSVNPQAKSARLDRGKEQGENGRAILRRVSPSIRVRHILAGFTQFAIRGQTRGPTTLHLMDPEGRQPDLSDAVLARLVRASYASFFSSLGHRETARVLQSGEPIQFQPELELAKHPAGRFPFARIPINRENPLTGSEARKADVRWIDAKFFLRDDVLQFLNGRIAVTQVEWPDARERQLSTAGGITLYADGTAFAVPA